MSAQEGRLQPESGLIGQLKSIVGEAFATDAAYELWCYRGYNLPESPAYVVRPRHTSEVAAIVRAARARGVPIIPRGLASRATPAGDRPYPSTRGGIIVDTTRMNSIRHLDPVTMTVTAEAGMTLSQLSTELVRRGYRVISGTLAPFCATVGSITGNGPGAIRYGTRQEQVVDLEIVLGTGEVLQTEPANFGALVGAKYASPNLTGLFLKARGTLGIVTAVTFYMYRTAERTACTDYGFSDSADTVRFLLRLQEEVPVHLPGVFEVYLWPDHTLRLYANNPLIREQGEEFRKLLASFPPFPADVVGLVLEGAGDQVEAQLLRLEALAGEHSGKRLGPEPVRDHYADCLWSGNTKAHEDSGGVYAAFAEPHFETQIDCYQDAREMTARVAEQLGFAVGERYWRGSRLSRGMLTHSAAVTFNDLDPSERERAGEYYRRVAAAARRYRGMAAGRADMDALDVGRRLQQQIKRIVDPDGIMYPGVETKEE
jgi:FAD/FMN-containing dehydrogenase